MWRERVALVGATCSDTKAGMHGVVSSPGPMPGCAPAAGERLRGGGRVSICSFLGPRIVSAPDLISSVVSTPLVACLLLVLDCSSGRVALLPLDRVGVSNSGKLFMRPQPGAWRALHRTEGFSPRICLGLVICAFTLGITGITATLYECIVVNVNLFVLAVLLLHCLWPLPVFKLLNTSGCKRPL